MSDVIKYLNKLLNINDKVVVGISGGPDSMLLLKLLSDSTINNSNIIVAHINHNVRKESDAEEKLVEDICHEYGVVFHSIKLPKKKGNNFEKWAREKRYHFYEELISKYRSKYLMTAHHGDDLVETILMKIVRGSNIKGYSGFAKEEERENYILVRPLISKTKDEIIDYNDKHNIAYVIDESNTSLFYTRNRYRHNILRKFKEEDHNVHFKFLEFSENIRDISNFFERYAKLEEKKIFDKEEVIIDKFLNYDIVVQRQFIYNLLFKFYGKDIVLINRNHIDNIIDVMNNKRPNITLDLPDNKLVIKEYNRLYIKEAKEDNKLKRQKIKNKVKWNGKEIVVVKSSQMTSNYVIYLNSSDIKLPLYVRCRKEGDRMKIKNMKHYKKVKDIFINEKIEMSKRDSWPIVVDSDDEIVWIPGLKKSDFDKQKSKKYDIILEYH